MLTPRKITKYAITNHKRYLQSSGQLRSRKTSTIIMHQHIEQQIKTIRIHQFCYQTRSRRKPRINTAD